MKHWYVVKIRGEENYYRSIGRLTSDPKEARVVEEDVALGILRLLPFPADAIEIHPWWTGIKRYDS